MDRRNIADLLVLQAVVEAGSFTRAAARMGRAQSGLSHSVRALEDRLGVPLLARTTRSVRLTEAGQRLLAEVEPAFRQIENGLATAVDDRNEPSGCLRITASDYPAQSILLPALPEFLARHPRVDVDIHVADQFIDIVEGGFDAGIRFGAHIEKDMIALPVGPDVKAVVVGSPGYFTLRGRPQGLEDLGSHDYLNYRTASHGDLYRWMFRQGEKTVEVSTQGRITLNDGRLAIEAAIAGLGLAYVFEPHVAGHLAAGRLETCLEEFCPVWSGYHLYYPSRHQKSAALTALVDVLKRRRGLEAAQTSHS